MLLLSAVSLRVSRSINDPPDDSCPPDFPAGTAQSSNDTSVQCLRPIPEARYVCGALCVLHRSGTCIERSPGSSLRCRDLARTYIHLALQSPQARPPFPLPANCPEGHDPRSPLWIAGECFPRPIQTVGSGATATVELDRQGDWPP